MKNNTSEQALFQDDLPLEGETGNRRRHDRFTVNGQTMVTTRAGTVNGNIINVSANGVCVSGHHCAELGEAVKVVHIPVGHMEGRVARIDADSIAVEFPISAASIQFALDAVMQRLKGE